MRKGRFLASMGLLLFLGLFCDQMVFSQEKNYSINTLRLESRADFDFPIAGDQSASGFSGKYLNFCLAGYLSDHFSYHFRQRVNAGNMGFSKLFFQGTDWMYLTYHVNPHLSFSAGKQVIAIGGWEYDLPPIDMYFWSSFWNGVNCYEVGASATYSNEEGDNSLTFQICNSPFITATQKGMYAYNLIWYGTLGHFKPIYSLNLVEYDYGKYITYIALGNKFVFDGISFYFDFMNRASFEQENYFFDDFSLIGEMKYNLTSNVVGFLKGGYDVNKSQFVYPDYQPYDMFVLPGTEYSFGGLGFEYYVLRAKNEVRLHAFAAAERSVNSEWTYRANLGLTYRIDFKK
jgi:hypothetical protein